MAEPWTANDLTTQWDETTSFPFVEDENCNITAWGHQDPATFAAEVNRYDEVCLGEPLHEDDKWDESHISHRWALPHPTDDERLVTTGVTAETPGAIAITTLWGQR